MGSRELREELACEICFWCREHHQNGESFVPYGDTIPENCERWQVSSAMGVARDWNHFVKNASGRLADRKEKCAAWMLWTLQYAQPDTLRERLEGLQNERNLRRI